MGLGLSRGFNSINRHKERKKEINPEIAKIHSFSEGQNHPNARRRRGNRRISYAGPRKLERTGNI